MTLGVTTHQTAASTRPVANVVDQQVNANNPTNSNHHVQPLTITAKQPPPPSKPPPPPPPPPRSNCYQSQQQSNILSSSASQHSFNANSVMTNNNSMLANSGNIISNGIQSNGNCIISNNSNNNTINRNKYLTMTNNTNNLKHGSANLSPGSSMSSHSSLSMLSYPRSSGGSSTHCNCHNANTPIRSNVSMTLGRNVHNELRPICNHLQDNHHSNHMRPYQRKCSSINHSSDTTSPILANHICSTMTNHNFSSISNHNCPQMNDDHLVTSFSMNNMNSNCGFGMQHTVNNDVNRCQSIMGNINSQQPQIFQASPATVCFCSSNVQNQISGNTASIGPIVDSNSHNKIAGVVKNCSTTSNHKPIFATHMHNLSDSSSSTTTNAGNMLNHHLHHHHNLSCIKGNKTVGSVSCFGEHYGPSSAASTSSANTSSLCSFSMANDLPPPYPLSKINQPLPPLPSQPPPPPPPPPKTISQQYLQGKKSPISINNQLTHQQLPTRPPVPFNLSAKQLPTPSSTNAKTHTSSNNHHSRKSDIPPPLPPPNPGSKMAVSGLISSNMSDSSNSKTTSPSRSSAWPASSSSSLSNLLNYDVTKPKPPGPTEAEIKLEALTKHYENEQEQNQKNGEHLGICAYCGDKVKNAKDACRAMGQIFHVSCFVCCLCKRTLRGKTFYHVQDKVYCEEDYKYSGFQQSVERCAVCNHPIIDMILQAMGKSYHPACFKCCICGECLDGVPFTIDMNNKIYCVKDYHRQFAPKCAACGEPITPIDGTDETVRVVSMDKDYHVDCYCCEVCGMQLTDDESKRCYPLEDHLLCQKCHIDKLSARIERI